MSNLAGVARVAYEAVGLADFKNDNAQAEASYRSSTRGMSDEAIKLELAQDKLRRSLQKGPAAYREQARAELQVRNAERALRGETDALTRSQDRNRAGIGRLRAGIVGLAAGYVGVHGLVNLTRSSIRAAIDEEAVRAKLLVAFKNANLVYEEHADRVDRVIQSHAVLSGLDDEELAESFANMLRSTKDVNKALELNAIAADIARTKGQSLATTQSLVARVYLGSFLGLRRLGVEFEATGNKMVDRGRAIAALQKEFAGQAEAYGNTTAGSIDRLSVSWENLQEILGGGVAPAIQDFADRLTLWLDKTENQEELQRRVNQAVETGETVVRALGGAFDFLDATILGPLKSLGLLDEVITTVLILGLVAKARRAAASFGLIAAASTATSAKMVRDATVAGRAWDLATRPRAMFVSTTVTGGGVPTGMPAGGGRFATGGNIALLLAAILGPDVIRKLQKEQSEGKGGIGRFFPDYQIWPGGPSIRDLLGGSDPERDPVTGAPRLRSPDAADAAAAAAAARAGGGGGGRGGRPRRTMADIVLDEARAANTAGTGDDVRFKRERRDRIQRHIDMLEAKKNLTAKQKAELAQKYRELESVNSEIDAIIDANEQAAAEKREKAAKARAAKRAAEAARLDKILDAAEKTAAERGKLLAGTGGNRVNMRRQALRGVPGTLKELGKQKDPHEEMRRMFKEMSFEFLGSLQGVVNQAAGNLIPPGMADAFRMTNELERQTSVLVGLARGVQMPGSRYARTEFSALFDGPTF